MRVTLVALSCRGGMLHYTSQLANALGKLVRTYLILPEHSENELFSQDVELLPVRTARTSQAYLWTSLWIPNHLHVSRAIQHTQPDVVHFVTSHPWNPIVMLGLKHIPIVFTLHDPKSHVGEHIPILRLADRILCKRCDTVFVHGQYWKQYIERQGQIRGSVQAIPHGSYEFFTRWQQIDIDEQPGTVLFFGRITPYKGVSVLLESIPVIEQHITDFQVVIAGAGKLDQEAVRLRSRRVELINDFIADSHVAALFQRSQVVVLPYIDASQSGIIPIAYAFAKPVVATHVGAIPEAVDDGVTGLLVPPSDPVALGEAIASLLKNPTLCHAMGQNGLSKLRSEMAWDRIATRTCDEYARLLSGIVRSKPKHEDPTI